ncbi:glycoside hydrolase, partial [Clavulina sp. PMI_390]
GGLDMYLERSSGTITRKGRVNSVVASGATVNSTFLTLYGKFSFEPRAPIIPGVVVAAILTAPGGDETDIELLGGDPTHWQTNIFAPQPGDTKPLYGVFGGLEPFSPGGDSLETFHTYTIDWNANRIIWVIHHPAILTPLSPAETKENGRYRYPSHPMRVQLGIWDAISPEGTSEWAKGPINWSTALLRMIAIFKSVRVQC